MTKIYLIHSYCFVPTKILNVRFSRQKYRLLSENKRRDNFIQNKAYPTVINGSWRLIEEDLAGDTVDEDGITNPNIICS